jgi:hypothetical protein
MKISAHLEPFPTSPAKNEYLYRNLEIKMQGMGHLVAFREQLNWSNHFDTIELGDAETLNELKRAAAKNDGVMLFYAKFFKRTVFKHLIFHPNDHGYYLPFPFDEPFYITIKGKKSAVGSSIKLLEELDWMELMLSEKYQQTELVNYWRHLRLACEQSIENFTPMSIHTKSQTEIE